MLEKEGKKNGRNGRKVKKWEDEIEGKFQSVGNKKKVEYIVLKLQSYNFPQTSSFADCST